LSEMPLLHSGHAINAIFPPPCCDVGFVPHRMLPRMAEHDYRCGTGEAYGAGYFTNSSAAAFVAREAPPEYRP
jgi:hypothetical protein